MSTQNHRILDTLEGLKSFGSIGLDGMSESTKQLIISAADVIIESICNMKLLALFFNGGKDSTVLLYLIHACLIMINGN
jgi:hypothetical protein